MPRTRKKGSSDAKPEPASPELVDQAAESAAPQMSGDTTTAADERDRIAARAYELYLERGGVGGDAMEDWLAAEREFSKGRAKE